MSTRVFMTGALTLAIASVARGQANFAETFDNLSPFVSGQLGPASLANQGWIFRNQSQPAGGVYYTWRDGPYMFMGQFMTFSPQAGGGYLGADARSTETAPFSFGGTICDWAILPAIPDQQAGDVVTLWARRGSAQTTNDIIEIRYSPGGGTNSGAGPQGIGDFTVLLRSINPVPNTGWGMFDAVVPGPGRLAIRYLSQACAVGCFQPYIGIDSISVGPPPLPCPDFPAIPQSGQQATWTLAGSPYHVCADVIIPVGATVVIEPGVTVNVDAGRSIVVEGTLLASGTQAAPITLAAADRTARIKVYGAAEFDWTTLNCPLEPQDGGGVTRFRDCEIRADLNGLLSTFGLPTYLWESPPFVSLDRCDVTGRGIASWDFLLAPAHVALRHVTFSNIDPRFGGYVFVDHVTSTNSPFAGLEFGMPQGVYVNNVGVTGAARAGLDLFGNCLIGPDNVIQNNLYPVDVTGLLPGSVVPATGNINNLIPTPLTTPGAVLADLGLPYVYDRDSGCTSGWPNIEPGVTIKMAPNAAVCNQGGLLLARGLPGAPITFERLIPGTPWNSLLIGVSTGSRLENCVIDGAGNIGLIAQLAGGWIIDSVVRNCTTGANANTYSTIQARKTLFSNNGIGVSVTDTSSMRIESTTLPNGFEGNGAATHTLEVGAVINARFNWWGHPTGPSHATNPGGQGDAITGSGVTYFVPFLDQRPDFDNHPPVVRLSHNDYVADHALHRVFEPGSKFIVEWSATDDDTIVEQRLLFSPEGDQDGGFSLVATLPAGQRSYEWTVPSVGFINSGTPSFLRVVAVDTTGQEGWDEIAMRIPSERITTDVTITSDFSGLTFRSGQTLPPITWTATGAGYGSPTFHILLDGDEQSVYLGGGGGGTWLFTDSPYASTDTARIAIAWSGTTNDFEWFFGGYFSLRPDSLIGDAPPQIQLLAPQAGESYAGGGGVPISWTASDDEGLRSFNVQATYDGGRTWHVIARDLPGSATSYAWPLPAGDGIADVRVRVVAKDLRFQNSSSTSGSFEIVPGAPLPPGDIDGDGDLDEDDVALFTAVLLGMETNADYATRSDLSGDGSADGDDVQDFMEAMFAG